MGAYGVPDSKIHFDSSSKLSGGGKCVETAGLNLLLSPLYSAENPLTGNQTQSVPSMTSLRNEQSK